MSHEFARSCLTHDTHYPTPPCISILTDKHTSSYRVVEGTSDFRAALGQPSPRRIFEGVLDRPRPCGLKRSSRVPGVISRSFHAIRSSNSPSTSIRR